MKSKAGKFKNILIYFTEIDYLHKWLEEMKKELSNTHFNLRLINKVQLSQKSIETICFKKQIN